MSVIYIADNPSVYTSQQAWEIDPTNGSDKASGAPGHPLKTWAELRRRFGDAAAPTGMEVKLLASLPSSDPLRPPYLGPTSTLLVYADMTSQHTGTFTAVTAAAPTTSSGTRTRLTDSALTASGFAPYINMLITIVGGTRDAATAVLAKDTGSKTADIQQFQGPIPNPVFGFNLVDPLVGDAYRIDSWSVAVGAIEFDQPISADASNNLTQLTLQGLRVSAVALQANGTENTAICFVNCKVTAPRGKATFVASLIDACVAEPGDDFYLLGCLVTSFLFVDEGGRVLADGRTSFENAPITVFGQLLTCEVSLFNAAGDGIAVQPGGMHQSLDLGNGYTENLFGSGSTGFGVRVRNMAGSSYVTKPRAVGSTGNAAVGGTSRTWAAIPFINTANNAEFTQYA
jgi:hypothetical protein